MESHSRVGEDEHHRRDCVLSARIRLFELRASWLPASSYPFYEHSLPAAAGTCGFSPRRSGSRNLGPLQRACHCRRLRTVGGERGMPKNDLRSIRWTAGEQEGVDRSRNQCNVESFLRSYSSHTRTGVPAATIREFRRISNASFVSGQRFLERKIQFGGHIGIAG